MVADVLDRPAVPRWEKALTVFLLFLLTKPFYVRPDGTGSFGILEYGPSGNLFMVTILGTTFLLMARRGRPAWRLARADWWLVGLVTLCIASTAWSLWWWTTLRAGILLGGSTMAGVYLAERYTRRELIELVALAVVIAGGLSFLAGLASPAYGISEINWRGIYQHKNNLGRLVTLGAIACALVASHRGPWRPWAVAASLFLVVMVGLSGSSTGIVVIAAALVLIPLSGVLKGNLHLAMSVTAAAVLLAGVAVALFLADPDRAFEMVGRDATLTGRTALWSAVVEFIARRPLLGYGYQAFWFGEDASEDVKAIAGWVGASAHNGFLDLTLAIGVVGLTFFVIGLLLCIWRAVPDLRRAEGVEGVWPLTFLAYFILYNLTETSLLIPTDMLWALYVATCLSLRPVPMAATRRVGPRYRNRPMPSEPVLRPGVDGRAARAVKDAGAWQ